MIKVTANRIVKQSETARKIENSGISHWKMSREDLITSRLTRCTYLQISSRDCRIGGRRMHPFRRNFAKSKCQASLRGTYDGDKHKVPGPYGTTGTLIALGFLQGISKIETLKRALAIKYSLWRQMGYLFSSAT